MKLILPPKNHILNPSFLLVFASFLAVSAYAQDTYEPQQSFPQVDVMSPLGVDMQTGNFVQSGTDLQIGPLSVDHYVRSRTQPLKAEPRAPSQFATNLHGIAYVYDTSSINDGTINKDINAIVQIGSLRLTFDRSNIVFLPIDSSNTGWKMTEVGTQWLLVNKSGEEYRFDVYPGSTFRGVIERRLSSKTSADGHVLNYSYDSSAKLKQVVSNRGYMVRFEYVGNDVRVCGYNMATTAASALANCASAALKVTYGGAAVGSLTSITQLDGSVINIVYETGGLGSLPKCITLPNSSTCRIKNTHYTAAPGQLVSGNARFDHVIRQETAEGEVFNYEHQAIDRFTQDTQPDPNGIQQSYSWIKPQNTVGTDNLAVTNFEFGNGFLQKVSGASGDAQYQYASSRVFEIRFAGRQPINHYYSIYPHRVIYPEGNQTTFTRDWADNVTTRIDIPKAGSGETNQVTRWTYPTSNIFSVPSICNAANVLCDKPVKIIDPKGNENDYSYSAVHGGVLNATGPANASGVRPQTRYTYSQRNARDAAGNAMQPPIWMLLNERSCTNSNMNANGSCAGGASQLVVTSYDYGPATGPNNLLLRGTAVTNAGKTLRTCYTYDNLGRKISETQPKGTGSTCS